MSGDTANDIASLGRLSLEVYRICRDCQGEYRNLASDCREISNTCTDIEDALRTRKPGQDKEAELVDRTQDCRGVLQDLKELLDKYNGLPVQSRRTWDRLHWDQRAGGDVRARLKENVQKWAELYRSLTQSDQVLVEEALGQIAAEIRSGRGDATSVVTFGTSNASSDDEDSGWAEILRDLQDRGISESVARANKAFIVEWILQAINMGWLDEKIPDETAAGFPIPVSQMSTPPPLPPKLPSPLAAQAQPSPSLSQRGPDVRAQVSFEDLRGIGVGPDDRPPSPVEEETNILWTAQLIVEHWSRREWPQARSCLQSQIDATNRGQTILVGNVQVQPDVRILRHLIGICYSFEGDFVRAKQVFESVLRVAYGSGLVLDDGDIAASRWLGETCIMLNEPHNAALAWAISVFGIVKNYGPRKDVSWRTLHDLRSLNNFTGALSGLKGSFVKFNRDASTILDEMPATMKYQVVLVAIQNVLNLNNMMYQSNYAPPLTCTISEGFLTQPLVSENSWPLPQDPFFRSHSAMTLLSILSKPKMVFPYAHVAQTNFGINQSKQLAYATKLGIQWLVGTIQVALNTYAIEWKLHGTQILCRVSHAHQHIAYYEVYGIQFKKISFRSIYGFKISDRLYSTRAFVPQSTVNGRLVTFADDSEHVKKTQTGLADRLKEFLAQAERYKVEGKTPPWEMPEPPRPPFEVPNSVSTKPRAAEIFGSDVYELPGGQADAVELPAQSRGVRRQEFIAELPAEPFR